MNYLVAIIDNLWAPRIWNKVYWMPYFLRDILISNFANISENSWERIGLFINKFQKGLKGIDRLGEKAHKLSKTFINIRDIDDLYFNLLSVSKDPSRFIIGTGDYRYTIDDLAEKQPKDIGIKRPIFKNEVLGCFKLFT